MENTFQILYLFTTAGLFINVYKKLIICCKHRRENRFITTFWWAVAESERIMGTTSLQNGTSFLGRAETILFEQTNFGSLNGKIPPFFCCESLANRKSDHDVYRVVHH